MSPTAIPSSDPAPPPEALQRPPASTARRRRQGARRRAVFAVPVLVLIVAAIAWSATRPAAPTPGPVVAATGGTTIRAEVRPTRRATLAAINPGSVEALFVEAGQTVEGRAPIARLQGPAGAEIVVAPWRGSVTMLHIHLGDTVLAGTLVASIADLTALQVETVDADEFQVARLAPGADVTLTVDALNETMPGRVRSIALDALATTAGDKTYLVVVDPAYRPEGLRSGMTVRVRVPE